MSSYDLTKINFDMTENFNKLLSNMLEEETSTLDEKFVNFLKYINDVSKEYPKPI